ncbi:MAG: acylphosphatase [Gammaproteobacteria bacterium]|nr:MAG: acylphosphatase [Gammaproteobacteria bacterium]
MAAEICKRTRVTGRVQGVWFRASTKQQADRLGVTGYANNLPDGSVEVLACGEATRVAELISWLHEGPELATVTRVDIAEVPVEECPCVAGFTTGEGSRFET